MTFSTNLNVLQDFTDDRDALTKVIKGLTACDSGDGRTAPPATIARPTPAPPTPRTTTEFNIFNTDRKLAALESAAKMLGSLPEKKALVYFASGMSAPASTTRRNCAPPSTPPSATTWPSIRSTRAAWWPRRRWATPPRDRRAAGHVLRQFAADRAIQLPGAAGDAVHAGRRHRRQGAARQQRSRPGHRAGAEGYLQLLHPRLLQQQHRHRRPLPPHQSAGQQEPDRQARLPLRATSPPRSSGSSRRPTRSASCRRR